MNRYRTLEWLNFVSTDLHRYTTPLFWSKIPDEIKQSIFIPALNKKLSIVEDQLKDKAFLMGERLTLPDSYLFVILIWLAKLKFQMKSYPNLLRFFGNMKKIKSVHQSLEEEELAHLSFL